MSITWKGFLTFTAGLFIGAFFATAGMLFANFIQGAMVLKNLKGCDPISMANTYIVFVTFIFVAFTAFITVFALWFSRWLHKNKEEEIKDNLTSIAQVITSEKNRETFARKIFESSEFTTIIKERVREIVVQVADDEIRNNLKFKIQLDSGGNHEERTDR